MSELIVIPKETALEVFTQTNGLDSIERCEKLLSQVEKHEEEQKELERLRAEKLAREQKEREERMVKEAEERGKREAEEAAKREIEKVQDAAFAAQEKIRIDREAEDRAKLAIEEGKDRMSLAEEAKKEAEAKRLAQEEAARSANEDHRNKVMADAVDSIYEESGITKAEAWHIVNMIVEGKVKHVSLKF